MPSSADAIAIIAVARKRRTIVVDLFDHFSTYD
jgi:hypothetical protein